MCRSPPPFRVPRLRGFTEADLSAVRGTLVPEPLRLKPADEFLVNEELRTCRAEPPFEIEIGIEIENGCEDFFPSFSSGTSLPDSG